jgi:hypothetical protein
VLGRGCNPSPECVCAMVGVNEVPLCPWIGIRVVSREIIQKRS